MRILNAPPPKRMTTLIDVAHKVLMESCPSYFALQSTVEVKESLKESYLIGSHELSESEPKQFKQAVMLIDIRFSTVSLLRLWRGTLLIGQSHQFIRTHIYPCMFDLQILIDSSEWIFRLNQPDNLAFDREFNKMASFLCSNWNYNGWKVVVRLSVPCTIVDIICRCRWDCLECKHERLRFVPLRSSIRLIINLSE